MGWMDTENMVHKYNVILFSHEREENPAACNNLDGPQEHYAKWNTLNKHYMESTYMQNLKKKVEFIEKE